MPISRWLLPVPESPSSTTGAPASMKQPAGPAACGALVDLGGQHLGQEAAVGEPLAGGVVGDPWALGGDGGQVQLPAGDPDGGLGGLLGHRLHAPTSPTAAWDRPPACWSGWPGW